MKAARAIVIVAILRFLTEGYPMLWNRQCQLAERDYMRRMLRQRGMGSR